MHVRTGTAGVRIDMTSIQDYPTYHYIATHARVVGSDILLAWEDWHNRPLNEPVQDLSEERRR